MKKSFTASLAIALLLAPLFANAAALSGSLNVDGEASTSGHIPATMHIEMHGQASTTLGMHGNGSASSTNSHNQAAFIAQILSRNIKRAADRASTVADMMTVLADKLGARLTATTTASTSADLALLADMKTKSADAKVHAAAAVDAMASVGSGSATSTVLTLKTAYKAALVDIQTAQQDLVAARKDSMQIIHDLSLWTAHAWSVGAHASTSASVH